MDLYRGILLVVTAWAVYYNPRVRAIIRAFLGQDPQTAPLDVTKPKVKRNSVLTEVWKSPCGLKVHLSTECHAILGKDNSRLPVCKYCIEAYPLGRIGRKRQNTELLMSLLTFWPRHGQEIPDVAPRHLESLPGNPVCLSIIAVIPRHLVSLAVPIYRIPILLRSGSWP